MKLFLPAFFLCFIASFNSLSAQTNNSCNVIAKLEPGGDSVFTEQTIINFTSASINATDYKIFIDIYEFGLNNPVNWSIQPGLTTVKLVAYNGNCTDTAVAHYFYSGTFPDADDNSRILYGYPSRDQNMVTLKGLSQGGYIIGGNRSHSSFFNEKQEALLIKTQQSGCVEWARKIPANVRSELLQAEEAANGNIFVTARVDGTYVLIHLSTTGDVVWTLKLDDNLNRNFIPKDLEGLPDGGLVMAGMRRELSKPTLIRLSNTGTILWQKEYDYNNSEGGEFYHLLYKEGNIFLGGNISYNNYSAYGSFLCKVNAATGQTVWLKEYSAYGADYIFENMADAENSLLVCIKGPSGISNRPGIGGFVRLNTDGAVLRTSLAADIYVPNSLVGPYTATKTNLIRSGNSFYIISSGQRNLSLQPYTSFGYKIVKIDPSFNLSWVESRGGAGVPIFYYNAPAPNDGVAIGGNEIGYALSPNRLATLLSLKIIGPDGTHQESNCSFDRQDFLAVTPSISQQTVQWDSDDISSFQSFPHPVTVTDFYPEMRFKCPDYVDSCSYLKLTGPSSACKLDEVYTFTTHKNKACGQPSQWKIPEGSEIISQTDLSVSLRFPSFGRYVIYATNKLSCNPVQDSILFDLQPKYPPVELGPDQEICPQNNTTLKAGPHYLNYEWQDGSSDSTLTAYQAGQYWVRITDSCGNIYSDTINVSLAAPVPFYAGPDREKCNNDTLQLSAQEGFFNYAWRPSYATDATNSRIITVNPLEDTVYTITAESSPGCFVFDTVRITVFHSPPIDLGADRSFCLGDSALFNAGSGFQHYSWNTGAHTSQIATYTTGQYAVTATTQEGCTSADTVHILAVHPLPTPSIDQNPVICAGTSRTLDAGGQFQSYVWSNGSTSASIEINTTGHYAVEVTDINGCKGSATTLIDKIQSLPSRFLPADTAICSYGTLTLSPANNYNSYLWSTGSTNKSVLISQPGQYILEVTDDENCRGKDSVIVRPKECMLGLYVPNAFSPNGDGINDTFMPQLFGNIQTYLFTVYNRWGEVVFRTDTPGRGWDGRFNGIVQGREVFIWTCNYQLAGQSARLEKGTVMLVR